MKSKAVRKPLPEGAKNHLRYWIRKISDEMENNCKDAIYRGKIYSEGSQILMSALASDEDGSLFLLRFSMDPEKKVLLASHRYRVYGDKGQALKRLGKLIVDFVTSLETPGLPPISAVYFDFSSKYVKEEYDQDPSERGSARVYFLAYDRETFGMSEAPRTKWSEDLTGV